jgi:hypothetical protein
MNTIFDNIAEDTLLIFTIKSSNTIELKEL